MASTLLIFPHQLFSAHPGLRRDRQVLLVEDSLFFGDRHHPAAFHKKKLLLHRVSIRRYAQRLKKQGFEVSIAEYDPSTQATLEEQLASTLPESTRQLVACNPVDFLVEKRLQRFASRRDLDLSLIDTPQFLTPVDWADGFFADKRKPQMAGFYTAQRKRMSLLLEADGSPVGGKWSFDADNRKKLPKGIAVPSPPGLSPESGTEITEAAAWVNKHFSSNPGTTEDFHYPTTHQAAERWLADFLEHKLGRFGDYEDAISREHRIIYHSLLTPMLNIGLLTPQQILDATLDFAESHEVPLNSLEGFIRQVIGWREFMRFMYQRDGTALRTGNFWRHERDMPRAFYDATTGIEPVDHVIRATLDTGYCHHIERLMILGNIMLLSGLKPDAVYRWFMELFIDAYDWVMVPNVYAMSQFADGGSFTTKPYISGSNYVRKMSDFPKGPWCETWDGLFWSFIDRNHEFFSGQPRMSMMARQLEKMDPSKRRRHQSHAADFLDSLA